MIETFTLPVNHFGEELEFKARLERWSTGHRIAVLIDEQTFTFEPDEEESYRALGTGGDVALLQTIAETLVKLGQL